MTCCDDPERGTVPGVPVVPCELIDDSILGPSADDDADEEAAGDEVPPPEVGTVPMVVMGQVVTVMSMVWVTIMAVGERAYEGVVDTCL